MAYCGPRGIALSVFLSWSEADQSAALEWQQWESRRHHACGTHAEDWDPEQGGSRQHQHWHPAVCPGCVAKERAERSLSEIERNTPGLALVAVAGPMSECPDCRPAASD